MCGVELILGDAVIIRLGAWGIWKFSLISAQKSHSLAPKAVKVVDDSQNCSPVWTVNCPK